MQSRKFEDIIDEYTFMGRVENSLRNYSNWLLGISLGLGAILISLSTGNNKNTEIFILPIIFVFIGILLNGYIKRKIFIREIKMNIHLGLLKKIKILRDARDIDDKSDQLKDKADF